MLAELLGWTDGDVHAMSIQASGNQLTVGREVDTGVLTIR